MGLFPEAEQSIFGNIYFLAVLIPSIAVGIRRMHDVDKSGWFILIPIYNLILAITDGTKGANRFGPDPKNEVAQEEQKYCSHCGAVNNLEAKFCTSCGKSI